MLKMFLPFPIILLSYILTLAREIFIPFTQTKILTYLCVREISSFTWANCIRGIIPQQIVIGFVDHQAYVGNYAKNPFSFETFGIRKIDVKINGVNYPATPYNMDLESGDFF